MLEFVAYKKYKKNKAEKAAKIEGKKPEDAKSEEAASSAAVAAAAATSPSQPAPLLDDDDAAFLERLTSPSAHDDDGDDDGTKPPLPPRSKTPELTWDSDSESFRRVETEASKGSKKTQLLSLFRRKSKSKKDTKENNSLAVPVPEADREKDDLARVLDDLNLSARNNKVFSLSEDSAELVQKFTLVLKDLVNGVPTAVNDLTSLLDDRDGTLSKNYEKLPSSLKKLVTQLPDKLQSTLAPELLAAAAESQGLSAQEAAAAAGAGFSSAAKKMLSPRNIKDLVTKPGAVVSMLKAIMNALKLRWPAFMGTNVIWSLALFLLLFVLWYCHKRGREVRLEKEKTEGGSVVDGADRIEELPDDPTLPAPHPVPVVVEPPTPITAEANRSPAAMV
ncbi:hypothetical protein B0T25DRAFT_213470 [Lasiosphaeria hispida]|uniref:Ring-like domain-containing protein n=1 Tax=Lasiosphaeria hispida TaxID=260671 RepID=A0AAJ0HIT1_9PEZI|nr:hypothetical protein B0T25DRAFT_213470 [Lasiosphaeria hispida]